jgi:hypothetical protein
MLRSPSKQQGQPQEVHCTNMQGACVCQNGAATQLYTKEESERYGDWCFNSRGNGCDILKITCHRDES